MAPLNKLPFRHARRGERGTPFVDYLHSRIGHDSLKRERMLTFIHDWENIIDGSYEPPTVKRYAERWDIPLARAYARLNEFRELFPTEQTPTRLVEEIWNGVGEQQDPGGDFMVWERVAVISTEEPVR
jgi:hypothetical protein